MKNFKLYCRGILGYFLFTVAFILLPVANVYGEPVIITYEDALQMALDDMLQVRDADAAIREVQNQRDDLREYIERVERNSLTPRMQDLVNDLFAELSELEWQLWSAIDFQNRMQANAEIALQAFFYDMNDGYMLQTAIEAMVAAQGIGGNISLLEESRVTMLREINNIHNPNAYRYVIDNNQRNLNEMDRQMQGMRLQQEQELLMRENTLRVAIITLKELELAVHIMEARLSLAEENLRQMKVMHEVGMVSENKLRIAEQSFILSRMELSETLIYRNSAQQHLNHLLGQPLSQHTVVVFERDLPELPENMSLHIRQTASQTQTIRRLELNVISTRYALRNFNEAREREITRNQNAGRHGETDHTRTNNDRTRDALRESYNLAVTSHTQAVQAMEAAIRHGYNELERLLNRVEIQNIALSNAKTQLSMVQTNFELGRATKLEVEQANFNVIMAEQAAETTINQKWLLAFVLENPFLLF